MLRVAIVGCGKIADAHMSQIRRIRGCTVVGVCDREPLMAKQLCERFGVERACGEVSELLKKCHPDVIHITTPPQSHSSIAHECLEAGCHVYVEKPITLVASETEELIRLAERTGHKMTVGHDLQFSPVARRLRDLIRGGYLGGPVIHMESYYCYDLSDPGYAKALLEDRQHWVRKLPGKLLQNVISHGIARIAEFLATDTPQVVAHGFVSPLLRSLGEEEIIDELRVIISEAARTTAYFTFSSQMRPSLNQFRLYGPKNGVVIDEDHQTLIRHPGDRLKSYAQKFIPPVTLARQHLGNLGANARLFLHNDFHMKSGMKHLIERFYQSIVEGAPLPISYREIALTSRIMDLIFEQLGRKRCPQEAEAVCDLRY
jgi:predicted dehydrogenase